MALLAMDRIANANAQPIERQAQVTGGLTNSITPQDINDLVQSGKVRGRVRGGPHFADPEREKQRNEREKQKDKEWQNNAAKIAETSRKNVNEAKGLLSSFDSTGTKVENSAEVLNKLVNIRLTAHISNTEDKEAISKGIGALIKANIKDINVNEPLPGMQGLTLLHVATILNDKELTDTLIRAGADVNVLDAKGYSPLQHACLENNMEVAKLLAFNGAEVSNLSTINSRLILDRPFKESNVNQEQAERNFQAAKSYNSVYLQEEHGYSRLHQIVSSGKPQDVKDLVGSGYDINALDDRGNSPLFYAIASGNVDNARMLIANGAKVDILETPLNEFQEKSSYLKRKLSLDQIKAASDQVKQAPGIYDALHGYAKYGYDTIAPYMGYPAAETKQPHKVMNNTPMKTTPNESGVNLGARKAIHEGDMAALSNMINADKNIIKQKDSLGRGLLDMAAYCQNKEAVDLLLSAGAEPKLTFERGEQAARAAAQYMGDVKLKNEGQFVIDHAEIVGKVQQRKEHNQILQAGNMVSEYREYKASKNALVTEDKKEQVQINDGSVSAKTEEMTPKYIRCGTVTPPHAGRPKVNKNPKHSGKVK